MPDCPSCDSENAFARDFADFPPFSWRLGEENAKKWYFTSVLNPLEPAGLGGIGR
jgi:hypothetical protein